MVLEIYDLVLQIPSTFAGRSQVLGYYNIGDQREFKT